MAVTSSEIKVSSSEAAKLFRAALDAVVSFVSDTAAQPEEALLQRLTTGGSSRGQSEAFLTLHELILRPLMCLLDEVHVALQLVEESAARESTAPKISLISPKSKKKTPTPPPTIMSIAHLRAMYTAIEVLWLWGVEAPLSSAKLIRLKKDGLTQPKSLLMKASYLKAVFDTFHADILVSHVFDVWKVVLTVDRSIRHVCFRGMIMQRNLQRVVLAAVALKPLISNDVLSFSSSPTCLDVVTPSILLHLVENDDILLYVRALQHTSRLGSKTTQQESARLLTVILLRKDLPLTDGDSADNLGLSVILRLHLHKDFSETANPTDLLVRIAKLVTSVPSSHIGGGKSPPTPEDVPEIHSENKGVDKRTDFFNNISSQTLLLMTHILGNVIAISEMDESSSYILRVCVLMAARIAHMSPASAYSFLFLPLANFLKPSKANNGDLDELRRLGIGVRALHWLITCFPLSSPILSVLNRTDIVASVLSLQMFLLETTIVIACETKGLVADIVVKILRNTSNPDVEASILEGLIINGPKYGYRLENDGEIVAISNAKIDSCEMEDYHAGTQIQFLTSLLGELDSGNNFNELDSSLLGGNLTSFAAEMNGLIKRTKLVCNILTSSQPDADANVSLRNNDRNTTEDGRKVLRESEMKSKGAKRSLVVDCDVDDRQASKVSRICSSIFLRTLSGYLKLPSAKSADTLSKHLLQLPPPHICGTMLLVLKSEIALDMLLHDSFEILQLLGLFLQDRANKSYGVQPDISFSNTLMQSSMQDEQSTPYLQKFLSENSNPLLTKISLVEEIDSKSGDVIDNDSLSVASSKNEKKSFESLNKHVIGGDDIESLEEEDDDDKNNEEEIITTILALLVSILEMGNPIREPKEESLLREGMLPHLIIIAGQDRNVEIAQTASDLCLLIMTRNSTQNHPFGKERLVDVKSKGPYSFRAVCDEVKEEYMFDESPAMRGLGVRKLIVALREPPNQLTESDLEEASILLLHLMQDSESFVYLNVTHAIGRLINFNKEKLFKKFLSYFTEGRVDYAPLLKELPSSTVKSYILDLRRRAILSEAICYALRRADEVAHVYVPQIVVACLKVCRRRTSLQAKLSGINDQPDGTSFIDVDLTDMRVSTITSENEDGSENENSSKSNQHDTAVRDICFSADEVLFRQSAFSLLAEAVGLAGITVRRYLVDVIDLAVGTLKHETTTRSNNYKNRKDVLPVRRSSSFLLRHIVAGIEKGFYTLTDVGSNFKMLYRTLKLASQDKDDVVKFHAECGLHDIDSIMRAQLTLSEAQLTGENLPKIRVIH